LLVTRYDALVLFRALAPLASTLDRAVSRAITGRSASSKKGSRSESLGPGERVSALAEIASLYETAEPVEDVDRFFGAPREPELRLSRIGTRSARGVEVDVLDARWPSRVETYRPEVQDRFTAATLAPEAVARLFLAPGPARPAVILVHGYRAGQLAIEERMWPLDWLLAKGLDVALFVLPFHGARAKPGPPRFPSSDPRVTVEGFRQAIDDLRGLVRFFKARGAPQVGAMGMSLGGYTVSLLATVERELDFVVPIIPLASFADVALASGRLIGSRDEQLEQHAALERAQRVVSPFARAPKVDADAAVIVAGEGDRITPMAHGEKLAKHFGGELVVFPGGHLLQLGRGEGFKAAMRMLRRRGVVG
jgi:pimeloyl-ACP methyl ester carboxylesterase